jgi:hypothetical protein
MSDSGLAALPVSSILLQSAEFLDVIGTKVLWVFLLAIHSHLS